jgi:hypothetical protein
MPYPNTVHEDEVQQLITNVFQSTGYRLDRRDPIIAQFVVQRTLLTDFDKKQTKAFDDLTDRIIPTLREEGKKLEEQQRKLDSASRFAVEDVVERASESVLQRIRDAIREKDVAIESRMGEHLFQLKEKHDDILRKFKTQCDEFGKQYEKFGDTAAEFPRTLSYYLIIQSVLLCILIYVAARILGK